MKTIYLLVVLNLFCVLATVAQSQAPDADLFDQSVEYFEDEEYEDAAKGFLQLMVEYPRSRLLASAHYNLALTRYRMKEYEASKKNFLEILGQHYNERDENSLMEPYRLYKHHSCRQLAAMALAEQDYKTAEKYIHMFDKKYPYQHFCGNEWSAYNMYKAVMLSNVYEGTGQTKKAMEELLPYLFTNALASNKGVLDELSEILEKHFTREETGLEFKRAFDSMQIKETKNETKVSIQLYGVSVPVSDVYLELDTNLTGGEYYQKVIKENPLFKKFL